MDGSVPSANERRPSTFFIYCVDGNSALDYPANIERMFETFHQSPHGDFKPTFYNPFEIKHRRRTTKAQYRVLEEAYRDNNKPAASARKQIANRLGMTARAVQVWFQNRRAKDKGSKGPTTTANEVSPEISQNEERISHIKTSRKRLCSASMGGSLLRAVSQGNSQNGMARRHSMPDMHPLNSGQLPFRELHEAIFGKHDVNSMSEVVKDAINQSDFDNVRPLLRKNTTNMAGFFAYCLNLNQSPFGAQPFPPIATCHLPFNNDPMISGESRATRVNPADLTTPSISAPGSSPSLTTEDVYQQFRDLIHMTQAPNQMLVESVANDLASFTPAQLGMLLEENGKSPKLDIDLFSHNDDYSSMLLSHPSHNTPTDPMFSGTNDQYYFPPEYPPNTMNPQFH